MGFALSEVIFKGANNNIKYLLFGANYDIININKIVEVSLWSEMQHKK